eukprot:103608-Pelagomonas_calceolata.AAC.3
MHTCLAASECHAHAHAHANPDAIQLGSLAAQWSCSVQRACLCLFLCFAIMATPLPQLWTRDQMSQLLLFVCWGNYLCHDGKVFRAQRRAAVRAQRLAGMLDS